MGKEQWDRFLQLNVQSESISKACPLTSKHNIFGIYIGIAYIQTH